MLPTPAASILARRLDFDLAAVVSASHNPYGDNGIKFFDRRGIKLDDAVEAEVERRLDDDGAEHAGTVSELEGGFDDYVRELRSAFPLDLSGRRIALDCANGATYRIAPAIFERLGAEVDAIATEPDGRNINDGYGATAPEALAERMKSTDAEIGFAFDGDGDRLIAIDGEGTIHDGDELIALAARHLKESGELAGGVAVTVMTNYGFFQSLEAEGIEIAQTQVGDRYVIEALRERDWKLGGEQSGHIIWTDFTPTGDGVAAALLTLRALGDRKLEHVEPFERLPQKLENVKIKDRGRRRGREGAVGRRGRGEREARGPWSRPRPALGHRAVAAGDGRGAGEEGARRGLLAPGRDRRARAHLAPPPKTAVREAPDGYPVSPLMCGIVGYVGDRPCRDLLIAGLEKLEYRGYDSAGVSVISDGEIDSVRAVGNLANLREAMAEHSSHGDGSVAVAMAPATIGVAHTRWATHGRVTEENAHPHGDCNDKIHIVLNGIVENHSELRKELADDGHVFSSETDAEIVSHLIERHFDGDLTAAVREAFNELRGHYAFVAMHADHPDVLVAARKECPLVIGLGDDETFVASAIPAFLRETRRVMVIENGELVTITPDGAEITDAEGNPIERDSEEITWDEDAAEKGGYATFMMKEIHEQPDAVAETITDRLPSLDSVDLSEMELDDDYLRNIDRIVIVACGTSYHAGLVGRYAIEQWARVPVEMDIASEYRYRDPVLRENDLVIGITQSGETADTLAAMRLAREGGAKVLAVTNVMGSQATRDSDAVLFTRAGLEIGVAATKTFVSQVAVMYLLGLRIAELRGTMPTDRLAELIAELKHIPSKIEETIEVADKQVQAIARAHYERKFFLYLGRHIGLPVCLEGALKLKEISYIPTDAYAAGEMKHGPIALLDEETPVVCVATDSPVLEKMLSNVEEVRARGADVVAIASAGLRAGRRGGRPDPLHPRHRLDPAADPGRNPAPAAGLLHRQAQRPQRGPAAEPRQDGHRRVVVAFRPLEARGDKRAGPGRGGNGRRRLRR